MPYLVDTDILVDVSRNNQGAIACVDAIGNDWAISAMTALELISGAKNQREVELVDRLFEVYTIIPVNRSIGERAYKLLKKHAKSDGLRSLTPSLRRVPSKSRGRLSQGIVNTFP